jgi:hypothetical protein
MIDVAGSHVSRKASDIDEKLGEATTTHPGDKTAPDQIERNECNRKLMANQS